MQRMNRYYACGKYFGKILCLVLAVQTMFLYVLEAMSPACEIDEAPHIRLDRLEVPEAEGTAEGQTK